jgi:quercetin dioxygenase-like cupin family protein
MGDYTVIQRTDADDVMGEYPGEMRMLTFPLATEQVAVTWRHMPPDTGGKGSYGHRHKTQEEVIYVISGQLQAKLDDDVIELGPGMAVRIAPSVVRSVHNDGPGDVELMIVSNRVDDVRKDVDMVDDFWPR